MCKTQKLHWLMYRENRWINISQIAVRMIGICSAATAIVLESIYKDYPDKLEYIKYYFYASLQFFVLIVTLTNLWLRNDRDIIQGYSKVDNLVVVSVFQIEKRAKTNPDNEES